MSPYEITQTIEMLSPFKSQIPETFINSLIEMSNEERSLCARQNNLIREHHLPADIIEPKSQHIIDAFRARITRLREDIEKRNSKLTIVSKQIQLTQAITQKIQKLSSFKSELSESFINSSFINSFPKVLNTTTIRRSFKKLRSLFHNDMAEEPVPEWRKPMNYPLVVEAELNDELQTEALDLIVSCIERSQGSLELMAKALKEDMDKKTGPGWNCVVGEGFAHCVTYTTNMLFVYFAGNTGVLFWK
jgi:hypothetical protein